MADAEPLPKVTPYLLRAAESMCPRRLAREMDGATAASDPVHRSRLRDAFLGAARELHAESARPDPTRLAELLARSPGDLAPEEHAVLRQAGRWYTEIFGDRAALVYEHGLDAPTPSPARAVRVGGWVDLTVIDEHGRKELRQLDLWGGRAPADDPLELETVRLAVLRLSRWIGAGTLRVTWADLVHGAAHERTVEPGRDLPELRAWFEDRLAGARAHADDAVADAGSSCGGCKFVFGCPEHGGGVNLKTPRDALLPAVVHVSPTSLDTWHRCPRDWRDHEVLHVPASDVEPGTAHGVRMHDLLRFVHEHGSCHDHGHVDDVLASHGLDRDERVREEVTRHSRRCPEDARALGHEHTVARFHRRPMFMATARFDALWVHDGMLDARDYKTGQKWNERVADDRQARLQAWVLAPLAERMGLRVRIAFEHLAAEVIDDPDPFEPDADDLDTIEGELRIAVDAMRAETEFRGVAEPDVCGRCRYRSVCPDSAATTLPVWPLVEPDDSDDSDGSR